MPIIICICIGVCICTYIIYIIYMERKNLTTQYRDLTRQLGDDISPVDVRGMEGPGHEVQKKVGM